MITDWTGQLFFDERINNFNCSRRATLCSKTLHYSAESTRSGALHFHVERRFLAEIRIVSQPSVTWFSFVFTDSFDVVGICCDDNRLNERLLRWLDCACWHHYRWWLHRSHWHHCNWCGRGGCCCHNCCPCYWKLLVFGSLRISFTYLTLSEQERRIYCKHNTYVANTFSFPAKVHSI